MRLIKQAILSFRQGSSDKVYEVDLCQIGIDQYVVNFRYGRRGTALRDGTRTVTPVSLDVAEREFDKLVASKTRKGYRHREVVERSGDAPGREDRAPAPGDADQAAPALDPRALSILERLRSDAVGRAHGMRLDRVIWRAGELGISEAEPLLLGHWARSDRSQALRRYAIVWALARVGTQRAIELLERVCDDPAEPESTRRVALEGLRRTYDDRRRADLIAAHVARLPDALRELARSGPADALEQELRAQLATGSEPAFRALETLYLIDDEHTRPALLEVLRHAPLTHGYFLRIRHIFKVAELRRDGEVFGLLAYRFEKTPGSHPTWQNGRQVLLPYREPTRQYLRRRVWRTLRRLGRDGSPDYVKMAVGVLLPFTDDDAVKPRTRRYYRWRQPDRVISWDAFAPYWAFNHILHGRSQRYYPDGNGRAWRCRGTYAPGDPGPGAREEAFPELWERTPEALLHLLDECRCLRVHELAVKALRACPAFVDGLDLAAVAMLLWRPYDVTAELGLEVARRMYRRELDDEERRELVIALCHCHLAAARVQAREWIDAQRARLVTDTHFMATLVASRYGDNREYARGLLRLAYLPDDAARVLIGRLIAAIAGMGAAEEDRIAQVAETLLQCFGARLVHVGAEVIRDLLAHPAGAAQELAASLLLNHAELARRVPDEALAALIGSPHERARAMGVRLLAQLPDAALVERTELMVLLSVHAHEDLRAAIRPVIARLAAARADVAAAMVHALTRELMHKHDKGVHSHVLAVLRDDLRAHLGALTKDRIWQLLHHRHPHAQELGGILLASHIGPDELSVAEIVRLANHEILSVRRGAWAMCEKAIDRLRRSMATAVRLLDVKWQDSRELAFAFFRDRLTAAELTPDILVAICDSVRPDVQQFGRELITRYFRDQDGITYLTRLSEHPSEALQLFATNYLEAHAAGDPERIRALEPYFVTVLSRVNRARVAKQRCIAFLRREALASEAVAHVAARVLSRQSATIAIGDRAAMIEAMVAIERAHPSVRTAVRIKDAPRRGEGVGHGV